MMMGDETDAKKSHGNSILTSIRHELRKALTRHSHPSGSNDSLVLHRRKKNQEGKRISSETNRDSALSSEGSDSEGGSRTSITAELIQMTTSTMQSFYSAEHCHPDSEKYPADGTRVHIMSPRSQQGDGLLQLTKTCIGHFQKYPVYEVNFKGKISDPKTNLIWYFRRQGECSGSVCVFLHMLDPEDTQNPQQPSSAIPLEKYVYRLCRFKVNNEFILAVHKAHEATGPFSTDSDGLMNICYHGTKGGQVTFKLTDGKVLGTSSDGEVRVLNESAWPGYCTNPFTLFNIYDDVDADDEQTKELIRANGEN